MAEQVGLAGIYERDAAVRRYIDDRSHGPMATAGFIIRAGHTTSEKAVRRLRTRLDAGAVAPEKPTKIAGAPTPGTGKAVVDSDGVSFTDVVSEALEDHTLAKNWDHIFERFGLDPADFSIVDDTVKMSVWQQSKGHEDGTRDLIDLRSYSARFARRKDSDLPADVSGQWRTSLIENPVDPVFWGHSDSGAYVVCIADPQLGKKGTDEAVHNWKRGVTGHLEEIRALHLKGLGPAQIHVAWMGDETEGVCNNYTNQPHTVELNLSQQLELDYDLRMWTLRELTALGLPLSASSVISNHGEWTRNGGKDVVTTRGDNASTHIARQVQKTFREIEAFGGPSIDWAIGSGEPGVLVNLAGKNCYFSHGYVEKGKGASTEIRTKSAIERQILGSTTELGEVPLWFMAHYHHFYSQEFEGRTLFGMPSLEAERSSEYMLHQYGVWSPPGMLGVLIGRDTKRGWSNLSIH